LEASIPLDEIRGDQRDHDLRVLVVLWGFKNGPPGPDVAKALTVYNNYLDEKAKFSHFAHDGSSTSKDSKYAVGLKGKGFILSSSYLAELCQDFREDCESSAESEGRHFNDVCKSLLGMNSKPIGVGLNLASRFCEGGYSKASPRMLKIKKEDLRPLSVTQFRHESKYNDTASCFLTSALAAEMIITDPKGKLKNVESDDENDSEAETMNWSQSTSTFEGDDFSQDKLRKPYKKRVALRLAEKPEQKNQSNDSSNPRATASRR
jgi:hypothetical protein